MNGNMKFNYTAMWAYMNRISFFKDSLDIISKKKEISRYHHFSTLRFLFYVHVHKILAWRRKILDLKLNNITNNCPQNIESFVKFMEKTQKLHLTEV